MEKGEKDSIELLNNKKLQGIIIILLAFAGIGYMMGGSPAQIWTGDTLIGQQSIVLENSGNLQTRLADFTVSPHNTNSHLTKYSIQNSIIENDFGVVPDIYPLSFSQGDLVYDTSGNLLTPSVVTSTEGGNVYTYDVSGISELHVDDESTAGDVQVFDTVTPGNTVESTWVRVTRVDHVFTGDRVVQNGLIRLLYDTKLWLYVYSDSSWNRIGWLTNSVTNHDFVFTYSSINPNVVSLSYTQPGDISGTITIIHGSNFVYMDTDTNFVKLVPHDGSQYLFQRFLYGDALYDAEFDTGGSKDHDASGMVTLINPSHGWGYVVQSPTTDISSYMTDGYGYSNVIPGAVGFFGALPIAPIYKEAEGMLLTDGAVTVVDIDAYAEYAVQCNSSLNYCISTFLNTLQDGVEYTVYVRAKAEDGSYCRFYIYDYTDSCLLTDDSSIKAPPEYGFVKKSFVGKNDHNIKLILRGVGGCILKYDYVLIVPTGSIEEAALRSLAVVNTTTSIVEADPIYYPYVEMGDHRLEYPDYLSDTWTFSEGTCFIGSQDYSNVFTDEFAPIPPGMAESVSVAQGLDYNISYTPKNLALYLEPKAPGVSVDVYTQLQDVNGNALKNPAQLHAKLLDGSGTLLMDEIYNVIDFQIPGNLLQSGNRTLQISYYGWEFGGWSNDVEVSWNVGSSEVYTTAPGYSTELSPVKPGILCRVLTGWQAQNVPLLSDFCTWLLGVVC